jgi:DNA-binding Xre family transcriptional regulator
MDATKPTVRVKADAIARAREVRGLESDTKLAAAMRIDRSNLSRTLRGKQSVGNQFIAALCTALDASMNDLFMITDPDKDAAA